ncbi:hypothetical protein FB567DRAFT_340277 [Paraphoma chrysanthemicola]|uniref:Uncharacterized protein n=1 Tax=Paraphoma chrysanthemicola TaxID=798071 RepID=A0A8K0VZB4_9PLEO|nr:hypothetical protein FB567DRAFT_340277 [Paraphoma chrysanthemicola]
MATTHGGTLSGTEPDPFVALLHDFDTYWDSESRVFHRFVELPNELRFRIYEYYFEADSVSAICLRWPLFELGHKIYSTAMDSTSVSFLPPMYLVDRATGKEAIEHLVSMSRIVINHGQREASAFVKLDALCRRLDVSMHRNIQTLGATDVNNQRNQFLRHRRRGLDSDGQLLFTAHARVANTIITESLMSSYFDNLREVTLTFFTPRAQGKLRADGSILAGKSRTAPITSFLEGSGVHAVLRLKKLRRLTIIGRTHTSWGKRPVDYLDDTEEQLFAVARMGHEMMAEFRSRSQSVTIVVRLMYKDQCVEELFQ